MIAVISGLGLLLWVRLTPPTYVRYRDAVEQRLNEHAALRQHGPLSTFSTFMHESVELLIEEWADRDIIEAVFRGCRWATLGPGCEARVGLDQA